MQKNRSAVERPPIRFARSGDVQIAFQVTGEGPVDIVLAPGTVSHLDLWWDFPPFRREIEAWSSFARLVRFDKRGTGLSDRPTDAATLEERTDDIRAVMDAVGLDRAVIYGRSEGGQMACMFAAMYPERTTALITWGTMARFVQAEGHPWGSTPEEYQELLAELETNWPSEYYIRGPGGAFGDADPETIAFMMRLFQAAASPAAAVALERMNAEVDIRDILPTIGVPALLMCHTNDPEAPREAVRWMAEQIPGARFADFPGRSHFVGEGENLDRVIATIQRFLTGRTAAIPSHRRLVTILFLDVAGSTARAVELGDARWQNLLTALFDEIEKELVAFDGLEIDRAGDGLLAIFEGPSRAIRCAQEAGARAAALGLELRGGVHTGEAEVDGPSVRGVAVHVAARVCALAQPREVLVSSTVRDLAAGAGFSFDDRGVHELHGVPEPRQLYAVR
jgi:class 3 adenylate cyclase